MFRNKSVSAHQFAMVPRSDVPRSTFVIESGYKTTFDAGYLVPVLCFEVLPGDTLRGRMTAFCRLATPIVPFMDNLRMDSFFFFVPNRLTWVNWKKFMGEQATPASSISFTIPQMVCPAGGYVIGSLQDYFGLPTVGQVGGAATVTHSALPLRAYNLIYNEWFRDENLQDSVTVDTGDAASTYSNYVLLRRGKRHDYFTSALPWAQKGSAVTTPLGTSAPIVLSGDTSKRAKFVVATDYSVPGVLPADVVGTSPSGWMGNSASGNNWTLDPNGTLIADLSAATSATINALRLSFQVQRLLERDARGGTRYTEIVRSHFGVVSPDARLQRPEYLGGGSASISINPVAQTSGTGASGTTTPAGTLAAMGTGLAGGHGFSQSFTEHGFIIGLVSVRADLSYQQGLRRDWSRSTRYDYYFPAFAHLGEQAILNKEIYVKGDSNDALVFGYQERWAEYRYHPSQITGLFRSTAAGTLDKWHLAQKFTALPTLNTTFIQDTPPVDRVVAYTATGQQFIFDAVFQIRATRPMPMYSVPGLIDHF